MPIHLHIYIFWVTKLVVSLTNDCYFALVMKLKCIEFRFFWHWLAIILLCSSVLMPHVLKLKHSPDVIRYFSSSLSIVLFFFSSFSCCYCHFYSTRKYFLIIFSTFRYFLENNCSWCHQGISPQSNEIIGSSGAIFCCENCFLFWRRASFKRAKTCDFCKNIRNAVSYVDFNDGTTQLQFCSDKCLNQYKMQIFCRETQAQLELNPHLKDNKSESTGK